MISRRGKTLILILAFFLIGLAGVLSTCQPGSQENNNIVQNDTLPLTEVWEKAITYQKIPIGLNSLSAESCGTCHQQIYSEWKMSTHADAFVDPQFLSEWKKDDIYVCLNCHTPLQNQQEFVVSGLINGEHRQPVQQPNPNFDSKLQKEGITCASCHVREGSIVGTIGNTKAPHKTIKNPQQLSEKLCLTCHNAVEELFPTLVCTFETGDEWKKSPAYSQGKNCISCHMPTAKREIATGFEKRKGHLHYFPGSGIPKFANKKSLGLNGYEIRPGEIKPTYQKGEIASFSLLIKNRYAGHNVPTGDPERYFLITFSILDQDSVIAEKQFRIGEEWQWYPQAKKLSDNNLEPGEERNFEFKFEIPERKELQLHVEVSKHRMNQENLNFNKLPVDYPISKKVYEKLSFLKIE